MGRHRHPLVMAVLLLAALVPGACGGGSATDAAGPSAGAGPGLVAPTTDGGEFAFADLGGQPALLWFWAPW